MDLTVKTLLNYCFPIKDFVYKSVRLVKDETGKVTEIQVVLEPHAQRGCKCGQCGQDAPGYDRAKDHRRFDFPPIFGIRVVLLYRVRRVECDEHGVVTEMMPWACGKRQMSLAYMQFLSAWAKRMSWKAVADAFGTSWNSVRASVGWAVEWGLAHRDLSGITAIGVDELHWSKKKGSNGFVTLIYQIDKGTRRLLWVGLGRNATVLARGFKTLGPEALASVRVVCSDMCRAFAKAIRECLPGVIHVLDHFHITQLLQKALDETRRAEVIKLRRQGKKPILTKSRFIFLRKKVNVRGKKRVRLNDLLRQNLTTVRAYLLKEEFARFWYYKHPTWAGYFFDHWVTLAMRSKIEPMKKAARTLKEHRHLIFNRFKANLEISNAAVEGLNNKCRVVTRRSYGYRDFDTLELSLYHTLGNLPEPDFFTHRFW
ncbi:MAG: hypothetical protein BWK80_61540 [Desulfobacteraceae bacterium IS3]|nr:MAG: hypothetical protein BWK80_61540 [Desulfobacteraceae bacterium IS3]